MAGDRCVGTLSGPGRQPAKPVWKLQPPVSRVPEWLSLALAGLGLRKVLLTLLSCGGGIDPGDGPRGLESGSALPGVRVSPSAARGHHYPYLSTQL